MNEEESQKGINEKQKQNSRMAVLESNNGLRTWEGRAKRSNRQTVLKRQSESDRVSE